MGVMRPRSKNVLCLLALVGLSTPASAQRIGAASNDLPTDIGSCLERVTAANAAHDLAAQRRLLLHAETLTGRPEDAADVQRRIAVLDWKFERRVEEARARLRRATSGADPGKAWLALARLEYDCGWMPSARDAAAEAMRVGTTGETQRAGRLAWADAVVAFYVALRPSTEVQDPEELRAALAIARDAVVAEPGLLGPSRTLLRAAVLAGDGEALVRAWRSYYHVASDDALPNALTDSGAALLRLAPRLGDADAPAAELIALVDALRRSHFHDAAAALAFDPRLDEVDREDPRVRDALAYARFVRVLRQDTDQHYRKLAHGAAKRRDLDAVVGEALLALYDAVGEHPRARKFEKPRWSWLEERFGAHGSLSLTGERYDLHFGHAVVDESVPVEQYGHSAVLRYVALDHMVSNGFDSWAWEGGAMHGGWAGIDTMWHVRTPYANSVVETWRRLNDGEQRVAAVEHIARETVLDEARAAADPLAYLPGLVARLEASVHAELLARLDRLELSPTQRRITFLRELGDARVGSSILAHEGRHAIDLRIDNFPLATREFRAKLSEVAFAPEPRLAFGAILTPNIGDGSPHGQANAMVLEGVVAWMREHAGTIERIDSDRPLLPQLDRLTDEEMRAAVRSMDPLAQ